MLRQQIHLNAAAPVVDSTKPKFPGRDKVQLIEGGIFRFLEFPVLGTFR